LSLALNFCQPWVCSLNDFLTLLLKAYRLAFADGGLIIRGLFISFFIDALLTDDEPLWEPIE